MTGRPDYKSNKHRDAKPAAYSNLETIKSFRKSCLEHLRPASPPKTNPWKRNVAVAHYVANFTKPETKETLEEAGPISTQHAPEVPAPEITVPSDTPESRLATPSKSRSVLEAAAPRAGERYVCGISSFIFGLALTEEAYGYARLELTLSCGLEEDCSKYTEAS